MVADALNTSGSRPCGETQKKVSIITVCRNSAETIRETIESVLEQDYPNLEYVIVDGASNDGTVDIIREYEDDVDIFISEPDTGIYNAMNKGIGAATGAVVGMLNAGDVYTDKSVVSRLLCSMEESGADSVYASLVIVDARDANSIVRYYNSGNFHPGRLRYGWMPAHPTFFARREVYERYGGYAEDYRIAADFEMMVRLLYKARISYSYLPEVVVRMRTGGVSTSGLWSSWILNNEIVRACRENGLKTNLFYLLFKIPAKLLEYFRRPA